MLIAWEEDAFVAAIMWLRGMVGKTRAQYASLYTSWGRGIARLVLELFFAAFLVIVGRQYWPDASLEHTASRKGLNMYRYSYNCRISGCRASSSSVHWFQNSKRK